MTLHWHCFVFCSFILLETFPDETFVSHSTLQPTNQPNSNPNTKPILVDTLPTTVDETSTFRFTPEGSVGPPGTKNKQFPNYQFSVLTQLTGGRSNYDAESHITNF